MLVFFFWGWGFPGWGGWGGWGWRNSYYNNPGYNGTAAPATSPTNLNGSSATPPATNRP